MKIKICGLTNERDYRQAVELGADYTGFIFYDRSPRFIEPDKVKDIIRNGPKGSHQTVGVFVNKDIDEVKRIYSEVGLDIVQLHGDESPGYVSKLNLPCWKALRVKDRESLNDLKRYDCSVFLLDTFVKGQYGGTGVSFSPRLVEEAVEIGNQNDFSVIAAGGIALNNAGSLLELPHPPYGIDVNSSLEDSPGKKNIDKIKAFFDFFIHERNENKQKMEI